MPSALGSLLIDPLLTLADTAFVGRFSESANELAGMGSAAALLTFSFYLFNFLCSATTPLVASKRASGDEDGALAVGGQALSFALLLGGILTTGLLVLKQLLLDVMGTGISGLEANGYAIDFLTVRALAAPAGKFHIQTEPGHCEVIKMLFSNLTLYCISIIHGQCLQFLLRLGS